MWPKGAHSVIPLFLVASLLFLIFCLLGLLVHPVFYGSCFPPLFLQLCLAKMSSVGDRISAFTSRAALPSDILLQALAAIIICGGSSFDWLHQPADAEQVVAEKFSEILKLSKGVLRIFVFQVLTLFIAHGIARGFPQPLFVSQMCAFVPSSSAFANQFSDLPL